MQVVACSKCGVKNRGDESKLATRDATCGRCGAKLEAFATAGNDQDAKPFVITDQTFEKEVMQTKGRPVLIDCWAPWCGPCRMISPILDELAAESQGRYRIAKLNVDENPQTSSHFRIASIPTLLIFKNGQLVDRIIGVQPKQAIAERLGIAARAA